MGSRFSRIYHLCLRKRDGLSPHTVALLLTGLRTSVPEDYHHQKVYRHGFTAQNELLPLASDRRTGMAHRNQAISAPHPDWRFGRQRRRTAGILYTGRNTGYHRICPSTEYHHRPRNRYAGHAEAALSAYPELGCFGLPVEIPQSGFTQNIFCAGKDGTLRFLKNVLDEVCALFPSPYIHLGGDEAPKGNWDQCPDCRKRITTEGLKDSHDLQLWFSAQMANYLKSKGRKAIFWGDVVYHDGYPLPDNTVIQWWNYRGHKDLALRNAVKHHYPVICSSNYYTYLNFPVTPWKGYTEARTFDLKDVYLNNPSDKAISEKNPLILGMSCALWTDDGVTERMIDRRLFPRILALSEQMWHEGEALDFDRFYRNILHRKAWFEEAGFEFGPALKEDVTKDYKWD